MKIDSKKYYTGIIVFVLISTAYFIFFNPAEYGRKEEVKKYPAEWGWLQRTFPHFTADPSAHFNAIQDTRILRESTNTKFRRTGHSNPGWEFAGPQNIGGRVVDIEFNPKDPNIVYAAGATGGVLKSTDMGQSWFHIFDDQASLTIGDIAIDPQNPDIIYVGTGEANGGHNNFPGAGVYKSTDAGMTWKHIGLELTASIGRIIVDPGNTQRIFVAAVGSYFAPNPQRGVYFNNGGGDSTWVKSLFVSDSTGAIDLVMDPTNPDFMMATMWERVRRPVSTHLYGPTSGIYRTFDGGKNWSMLEPANGLPNPQTQHTGRIGLAMCASQPNVTYALFNDGAAYLGFYKTTDYGSTWVNADTDRELTSGGNNFTFSWYFGQVRVHPENPDIVYVLDVSFMRSIDGGLNWPIDYGYYGSYSSELHVDHHALAFNPLNPDYIISGNDGGINISTDAGVSWSNHAHVSLTQFYEIGLDYNNPERLYGGTQDNNTIRTTTGAVNDWDKILGGDGFYVLVDPTDPGTIYAEYQYGSLHRIESTGGTIRQHIATTGIDESEKKNWSTPVVMDPNNPHILYYGTDKIYRTTNKAETWTPISNDLTNGPYQSALGTVSTIAVAPANSNVIYAGTDDGNIWVTNDYGATWRQINKGLPLRWVTRVVVDPDDENIVYATFSGLRIKDPQPHVFKSTNMGEEWTDISANLPDAPVNAFAVDLNNSDILYLGNDVGIFMSRNGGTSWEALGSGIPIIPVNDIKIHPVENYMAIGTYGRGMYKIDLNEVTAVEDKPVQVPDNFALYQNYPNPFNPNTIIKFSLVNESHVNLKIFDSLGREVSTLVNETKPAGTHEINFNADKLSSGIYFYRLETNGFTETKKMTLLR